MHSTAGLSRRRTLPLRALALTAVAAGTVLASSSCAMTPALTPATVIDTPTIVWKNGVEPSSPLEASPYIQYLRALHLGNAVAWNAGDFTVEQLTAYSPRPKTLQTRYEAQAERPYVYMGPLPFEPVSVTDLPLTADGNPQVKVEICTRQEGDYLKYESEIESDQLRRFHGGRIMEYTMVYDSESKTISEQSLGTNIPCDNDSVPLGLFTPEPEVPSAPVTEPVRSYETLQRSKATQLKTWDAPGATR